MFAFIYKSGAATLVFILEICYVLSIHALLIIDAEN